jgi:diaminobutyrate-2-oxoglutarate transaminase
MEVRSHHRKTGVMNIFDRIESNVRGYCRSFPVVFTSASGALLRDEQGNEYIDFLAGAGTLNYGHNHPAIKERLIEYLRQDGVLHGLDLHTAAKREILELFEKHILWPLEMDYKVQFTGPTGTNAVEAALKLARNVTGRTNVVSFTNGFHGVSLGSVAATGNSHFRDAAGVPLGNVTFMPYDGYLEDGDTLEYLRKFLEDGSSGVDLPAAVILETVQGEGGVNVASHEWLQGVETICREFDILLIVDDIQVGCGRTGTFFSFEDAGIVPDIITLSKSLGGYGLPMSLVVMRKELDRWEPGEHNGTFRGNNLAFVAAAEALRLFWRDTRFTGEIRAKGRLVRQRLEAIAERFSQVDLTVRGRGLIQGIACRECPDLADAVSRAAFQRGLIIETSGAGSHVLKLLPPLTIERDLLERGLDIIEDSFEEVLGDESFLEAHGLVETRK